MSDNWIVLIPTNPRTVPEAARQSRARNRFSEIAPDAEEIRLTVSGGVEFFDCGDNFKRVGCPVCSAEVSINWWQQRMDEDYDNGFKLAPYATPCCGAQVPLNELDYEWPQGFGRVALWARNANLGKLDCDHKRELEEILGIGLRVIYKRA